MTVIDCEQGTVEWLQARVGNITASCLSDVMAQSRDKKSESTTRKNYRMKLVAERMTGRSCENGYTSKAMQNGNEFEKYARAAYEVKNGVLVDQVGFVLHPEIEHFGASPDFLVGEDGMGEIKCGYPATHIEWFMAGVPPAEHRKQMLGGMACCNRKWCDFISYCEAFDPPYDLFIVRFERDPMLIATVEDAVIKLNQEVSVTIEELRRLYA